MLAFYTEVLVPVFAGAGFIAFLLGVWKFIEDRRRASRRIRVEVEGAHFKVINESGATVQLAAAGYIAADWKAKQGTFEGRGTQPISDVIPAHTAWRMTHTLNTTLSAAWEAWGGEKIKAHGWWARLETGEVATTVPGWNLYGRLRFWLANRGAR